MKRGAFIAMIPLLQYAELTTNMQNMREMKIFRFGDLFVMYQR